ncbi:WbqC family protein [Winogradskyella forsetii]|uniref:WbqC family protein n=1 Tax=Winogradskyella forsetii TaxID=2686077 RepID=UPI0015B996ED|nr:WbqC family protein [Winogradskyella forsetii]
MTIAIMQPYFLPYIGYFQLIKASHIFVFYDDVNFIKGGWINRNYFNISGQKNYITIPCKEISSFKKINEVELILNEINRTKILKSINQSYKGAPNFEPVFELFKRIMAFQSDSISRFSANSIKEVSNYLDLDTVFYFSSELPNIDTSLDRADRLIKMVKQLKGDTYVNVIGGQSLYFKEGFEINGVKLDFIETNTEKFLTEGSKSILDYSILDLLMNENIDTVKSYLDDFIIH